jgi:hypothetical protein
VRIRCRTLTLHSRIAFPGEHVFLASSGLRFEAMSAPTAHGEGAYFVAIRVWKCYRLRTLNSQNFRGSAVALLISCPGGCPNLDCFGFNRDPVSAPAVALRISRHDNLRTAAVDHKEPAMTKHKFEVGEAVIYTQRRGRSAEAVYEIRSLLPSEGSDHRYRVRCSEEKHERVFTESQLELARTG